jgi:hypothetical protein
MAFDREAVFQALYTKLSGALAPVSVSRRVKMWTDVAPSEQPAVFIDQGDQEGEWNANRALKWKVKASIYVYVNDTSEVGPAPAMNDLVTKIDRALEATPFEGGVHGGTTLGGIVFAARVVGVTDSGGALGDQGVAVIDVEVITTS